MKRGWVRVLGPLGLAVVPIVALAGPAFADPATPAGFEVEAKTAYCQNGGTGCNSHISNLRFALAEVWRFSPGTTNPNDADMDNMSGTPELALAVCATHYLDSTGTAHARSIHVFADPRTGGTVTGSAWVHEGLESDKRGSGHLDVRLTDGTGAWATIEGTQTTNNVTDVAVGGGFQLRLHGMITDETQTTPPAPVGVGNMSCRTDVNPVPNVFGGGIPNYFESEVRDASDPNS